jgi:iron complex transport system permease protein
MRNPDAPAMRPPVLIGVLAVLTLISLLVGIAVGASGWRGDLLSGLLGGDEVLTTLRAPRVLLGALTGASLALAGVCMQAVLRNELADPYILGMAGGASAGAVISLAVLPSLPPGPAAAAGAAGATALVRSLARGPHDPTRLLLGGVAVGAVLASVTGLVLVLAPGERLLRSATYWLFGGFGTPGFAGLVAPAIALLVAFALLFRRAERLDRLVLGDDVAASLGTDPRRLRALTLVAGVVLTAIAVAAGGLIGFVGLVAPHAARRLIGPAHRGVLPAAALLGALVVTLADTVARTSFAPREVPLGLVTALLGGPVFLWLVSRRRQWA